MRKLVLLMIGACLTLGSGAARADDAAPQLPRAEIEQIVKDYLMREPEVVYQALQELQNKQEQAATEQRRSAIAQHADDLFHHSGDPVAGNADGDVTLVEFFDFRCGYCRGMANDLWSMIGQDKSLRVVFKDIPILGPDSKIAAQAALAAQKQGKYLEMHKELMQASDFSPKSIRAMAERHGLDAARLEKDMASPDIAKALEQNLVLASALGVNGTPSFVVGDTLVPGAVPIDTLADLIGKERAVR